MHEKLIDEVVLTRPMIRLMGSLTADLPEAQTEYSKTELAVCAGIGYATIHRIWPMVESLQLVVPTRKVGGIELFKANSNSKVLQKYREFVDALLTVELIKPAEPRQRESEIQIQKAPPVPSHTKVITG